MTTRTLIYSPGVTVVIDTVKEGLIDISDDLVRGGVNLRSDQLHDVSLTLNNSYRKYDRIFTPNDRIVVQMKRLKWLQVFAGYLDTVPLFSVYPREVQLRASCSLKALKHFPWDAGSQQAFDLIHGPRNVEAADGGIAQVVTRLLTDVARWDQSRIHIGRVPVEWRDKFQAIYQRVSAQDALTASVLGVNPIVSGKPVDDSAPATILDSVGASPLNVDVNIPFRQEDMDVVLATIRQRESRNNYRAVNKGDGSGDWATGAYQFTDTTWGNYGGFPRAYLAPESIQDSKARWLVNYIIENYGAKVIHVPWGWYYPKVFKDPTLLDKVPAQHEGNKLTIREYGESWLQTYMQLYKQMRGQDPPSVNVSLGGLVDISLDTADLGTTVYYPIPSGVNRLYVSQSAWGGFSNGHVPVSAMSYDKRTGHGHPAAIASYVKLLDEAAKAGLDLRGSCYRSYEQQASGASQSSLFAKPGNSIHGWGLAIDITNLTGMGRHKGLSNTQMYDTPEYQWLQANAYRFGWGHPIWARKGENKPEAWHWEFFAFENFRNSVAPTNGAGVNPFNETGPGGIDTSGDAMPNKYADQLFGALAFWMGDQGGEIEQESLDLWGYKAPMNDTPILSSVVPLIQASGRSFCAAPNGDFMAWFPDYWGEYGIAGTVNLELVELQDFSIMWSDDPLITHSYVEGGASLTSFGPVPTGVRDALRATNTKGVATVDLPNFLEAVINVSYEDYPWLRSSEALLMRFGGRINRAIVPTIIGPEQEFWFAVNNFVSAWASQFSASAPMTFMPELYPGMLLAIPEYKVQFYVKNVSHTFDFATGVGFSTSADVMAPSSTEPGGGFYLLPKGGGVVRKRRTWVDDYMNGRGF